MNRQQIGPVRAGEGPAGGEIPVAPELQDLGQLVGILRIPVLPVAGSQGQLRHRKARIGPPSGIPEAIDRPQPAAGDRGAAVGHLTLETVEPGIDAPTFPDQAVAFAHRLFVRDHILGMDREKTHRHPVKESSPAIAAVGPQPVHRRNDPNDSHQAAEIHLPGRLSLHPHAPAAGPREPCREFPPPSACDQFGRDAPSGIVPAAGDLVGGGPTHPPSGGEHGQGLQDAGLSGSVGSGQDNRSAVKFKVSFLV